MNSQNLLSSSELPKKKYVTPALQIYGTLAQITANAGKSVAASDGSGISGHPNTH